MIITTNSVDKSGTLGRTAVEVEFSPYQPKIRAGKLCYFTSAFSYELPLRDLKNEYNSGYKLEPNYETGTYNLYKSCNQPSVKSAIRRGLSHLLYITKYHGTNADYNGKYCIVGALEISEVGMVANRWAVRAKSMFFTQIQDSFVVTPQNWKEISPTANIPMLNNLRFATQTISGNLFEQILSRLEQKNRFGAFLTAVNTAYRIENWQQ